jgi:probable HAF family extracellular repeat protein
MDANGDGVVSIDEVTLAADRAQTGCAFFAPVASLPGWPDGAKVDAVSPDGTVLLADDLVRGWRWIDGRRTDLGTIPVSMWTYPVATSTDGAIVVGQTNGGTAEGFVWRDDRIAQFGSATYPVAVSADGAVIAGYRRDSRESNVAFRWRDGTRTDLGYLRPDSYTEARAMSADGSTVVGFGQYAVAPTVIVDEAFRWRDGTLTGLGFLASTPAYSTATAVSADGAVVVGYSLAGNGLQAYRWEGGVMTGLGVLSDYAESVATAVSGDGTIVFGGCQRTEHEQEFFTAFVWDREHGMRELAPVLANDFGLDLGGVSLLQVGGVSLDARTIVGNRINESSLGWIARLGHGW